MKEKVPVVPPPRKPGDPIPDIHPSREPEESPWLETYIDLKNLPGTAPDQAPAGPVAEPQKPFVPDQQKKAG